jgi:hypothetical protein
MGFGKYILVDNVPTKCEDPLEWAKWMEAHNADRIVKRTTFSLEGEEDILVSTVFLGLDHSFTGEGPALLYETMIFGGPLDQHTWRYATRAEALIGHDEAVTAVEQVGGIPHDHR